MIARPVFSIIACTGIPRYSATNSAMTINKNVVQAVIAIICKTPPGFVRRGDATSAMSGRAAGLAGGGAEERSSAAGGSDGGGWSACICA